MAKLNLKINVIDENGSQSNELLSDILARVLIRSVSQTEDDIFKFFDWAKILSTKGIIEVDESDAKKLRAFVIINDGIFTLVKHPIIKAIDNLKFK